jgi:hypothetical protein
MTVKRLVLVLLAACNAAGCCALTLDDEEIALLVASSQSGLESDEGVGPGKSGCYDCTPDQLRTFLIERLGPCTSAEVVAAAESDCTEVAGRPAVLVHYEGCDLGAGRPFTGEELIVPDPANQQSYYDLDVANEKRSLNACGVWSGTIEDHTNTVLAIVTGPNVEANLAWTGHTTRSDLLVTRTGTLDAHLVGKRGNTFDVSVSLDGLERTLGDVYPHTGSLSFTTQNGTATLTFSESTPTDGSASLLKSDGEEVEIKLPL